MKNNLRHFISVENEKRKAFKIKMATVPTCLEDSQWIVDDLSARLNLHEDGEINATEVQNKFDYLSAVHSELEELIGEKIELDY